VREEFTDINFYINQRDNVLHSQHLSVYVSCLLAASHKNCRTDLRKNFASDVSVDKEELIKLWKVICF